MMVMGITAIRGSLHRKNVHPASRRVRGEAVAHTALTDMDLMGMDLMIRERVITALVRVLVRVSTITVRPK